jgi:hypothetical protein
MSRAALLVLALCISNLGLLSTNAVAMSTTSAFLTKALTTAGNTYARTLLRLQPIPPGARKVTSLPTAIPPSGYADSADALHAWSLYLLPTSVPVDQYVRRHLASGETVTSTGISGGRNVVPVDTLGLSLTCVSPHITYCGVVYSTTEAEGGGQELRVDVQVVYLPIVHAQMPTDGVVTVTGYGKTSLMSGSSDATSVVLTQQQALSLHTAVAELKDFGGGTCHEDSILLKIKVVRNDQVVWRATADECPGALVITTARSTTSLDNHSCSFWHVVDLLFVSGTAQATKAGSKVCSTPSY